MTSRAVKRKRNGGERSVLVVGPDQFDHQIQFIGADDRPHVGVRRVTHYGAARRSAVMGGIKVPAQGPVDRDCGAGMNWSADLSSQRQAMSGNAKACAGVVGASGMPASPQAKKLTVPILRL